MTHVASIYNLMLDILNKRLGRLAITCLNSNLKVSFDVYREDKLLIYVYEIIDMQVEDLVRAKQRNYNTSETIVKSYQRS